MMLTMAAVVVSGVHVTGRLCCVERRVPVELHFAQDDICQVFARLRTVCFQIIRKLETMQD